MDHGAVTLQHHAANLRPVDRGDLRLRALVDVEELVQRTSDHLAGCVEDDAASFTRVRVAKGFGRSDDVRADGRTVRLLHEADFFAVGDREAHCRVRHQDRERRVLDESEIHVGSLLHR